MAKFLGPFDSLNAFGVGDRVELHPATDLWMRGARFGEVIRVGRKALTVRLDAIPDRPARVRPGNIYAIIG